MYTRGSQNFGIWRDSHASKRSVTGVPTAGLITALSISAFVAWLIYFLAIKIRTDYYILENSGLNLPKINVNEKFLSKARPMTAAVGIYKLGDKKFRFIFDSGESFEFPYESAAILKMMEKKANAVLTITMLTLTRSEHLGRVQLWLDQNVSFKDTQYIANFFTEIGFDDIDIAFEVK